MIKYFHELTDEEYNSIDPHTLVEDLVKDYPQPEWCRYPSAIDPLGCFSLIGDNRKIISYDWCKSCELHKDFIG